VSTQVSTGDPGPRSSGPELEYTLAKNTTRSDEVQSLPPQAGHRAGQGVPRPSKGLRIVKSAALQKLSARAVVRRWSRCLIDTATRRGERVVSHLSACPGQADAPVPGHEAGTVKGVRVTRTPRSGLATGARRSGGSGSEVTGGDRGQRSGRITVTAGTCSQCSSAEEARSRSDAHCRPRMSTSVRCIYLCKRDPSRRSGKRQATSNGRTDPNLRRSTHFSTSTLTRVRTMRSAPWRSRSTTTTSASSTVTGGREAAAPAGTGCRARQVDTSC